MEIQKQVAKHLREVYFGGNWTAVNLKESVENLGWEQAIKTIGPHNSIATLIFHINYYVRVAISVLEGNPIDAHDKYSFDLPPVRSNEDWQNLLSSTWKEAELLATLVEKLPAEKFSEVFVEEKYGSYTRNLLGIVEHTHYHLGQIVLLRKLMGAAG